MASPGRVLIGAGLGGLLAGGMSYLYRLHARGVPELNEELERAMRDRRYGFRRKDRYSAFGMSITAAKWAMVPVVLGLALIAIGVALLLA